MLIVCSLNFSIVVIKNRVHHAGCMGIDEACYDKGVAIRLKSSLNDGGA